MCPKVSIVNLSEFLAVSQVFNVKSVLTDVSDIIVLPVSEGL